MELSADKIEFPNNVNMDFVTTLRKRVNDYFKENNISKYGDYEMVIKTIVMTLIYLVPYFIFLSGVVTSYFGVFLLWILMGIGTAGIGLSIMHDANHGAYSKNKTVNKILGLYLNLVGGSAIMWKYQHNRLHHFYTNVTGLDQDIEGIKVLRFSPHRPRIGIHKLQFIYAWFFYGLMTISWVTAKEYSQIKKFRKMGLITTKEEANKLYFELTLWKLFYYAYVVVLPLIIVDIPVWLLFVSFLASHFVAGFILGIIFQPAHVVPSSQYPMPKAEGSMENNWSIHQLLTTSNFAPKSRIFSWFVGGLNYQVEHHLFPTICHIHYKKLSNIVQQTVKEFNLPYYSERTFVGALWEHGKMLYNLGRYDSGKKE